MAHRNYSKPRCGNLGFLPKKRCASNRGIIKCFPADVQSEKPHFTAFAGYKAGSTHVMRFIEHRGALMNNKSVIDEATVIDCPAMQCFGIVGYIRTTSGIKQLTTVYTAHIADSVKRRVANRGGKKENGAFSQYQTKAAAANFISDKLAQMKQQCVVIRVLAHTQPELTPIGSKRAAVLEIQINGGSVAEKVDFAASFLEKEIKIGQIFKKEDQLDAIAITKGRGFEGPVHRFGVTRLPRKTRRGNRKVACIGSWHPANMQYTCARAGQMGYFHRTEANKQVFLVADGKNPAVLKTDFDSSAKGINPIGGWTNYGLVNNDFIMIRGSCPGTKRRLIVMRQALQPRRNMCSVNIQWYCTASKMGHGMFETSQQKKEFYAKKVESK